MMREHDDWIPTRRSLLSRLRNWDDRQSWQVFFDTYSRLIYRAATKVGLSDADAQDVVQEVVIAVARQMPDFRYDPAIGSFKGWLLRITRRRIDDHWRQLYREPRAVPVDQPSGSGTTPSELPDPAADLERLWDAEWEQNLMSAAVQRVKRHVDARQFQIFDCHVLKSWPVQDVVATLGVSENQVYLAKSRITALIKQECERLQQEMV